MMKDKKQPKFNGYYDEHGQPIWGSSRKKQKEEKPTMFERMNDKDK